MTNGQLNRLAAEAMGWVLHECHPPHEGYIDWWITYDDALGHGPIPMSPMKDWSPVTNLNHAFMLLAHLSQDYCVARDDIEIIPDGGRLGAYAGVKDGKIARAITLAFLRAKGIEVTE